MSVTIDTQTLPSPSIDEGDIIDNGLIVYDKNKYSVKVTDPNRPTVWIKKWPFKEVKNTVKEAFETWLHSNIGKKVAITDAFSETFNGTIIDPSVEFVLAYSHPSSEDCDRWDFTLSIMIEIAPSNILLEDGDNILMESGDLILMEN